MLNQFKHLANLCAQGFVICANTRPVSTRVMLSEEILGQFFGCGIEVPRSRFIALGLIKQLSQIVRPVQSPSLGNEVALEIPLGGLLQKFNARMGQSLMPPGRIGHAKPISG